ncbi:MAG: prephenate dehydratase [Bryobacterales bacterium]|nr:prephenate dehydratase [Bryobacterales bacterium]
MALTKKKTRIRAGFQGEFGAFSQEATVKLLGPGVEAVPFPRFTDVFDALVADNLDYAVIPMENTLHGSVYENYDNLLRYECRIHGETTIRICHNLMAPPGLPFGKITHVYSHPVALNQCLDFFRDNPQISKEIHYDTAGSARMVMTDRPEGAAAIASASAAEIYGARILKRGIEDDRQNFTRFFLLARGEQAAPARSPKDRKIAWKTSIVFSVANQPGSLFRSIAAFALRDLSLTKISSRPLRGKPFDYLFYVDVLGHLEDPGMANALRHLDELADMMKVLGCYPKGDW